MTRTLFPETTSVTKDFILGDSTWNFVQVGYPVDTPTVIVVSLLVTTLTVWPRATTPTRAATHSWLRR